MHRVLTVKTFSKLTFFISAMFDENFRENNSEKFRCSSEYFKTPNDRDELMKFQEHKKVLNHRMHSI